MSENVFLFSGQGSQYVGMGTELIGKYPCAKEVFDEASEILGFDLAKKCSDASPEELAETIVSQPAIMAVSLAAFEAARAEGITFSAAAGHSLGEYAALAASGVVSRSDGFRLIKYRSEAMQKASQKTSGAMYAIIGKNISRADEVCAETNGYVVPVNYNSSVQTVIAGESDAAAAAAEKLSSEGFRTIKLAVSSAFHSKLMSEAAEEFLSNIKSFSFSKPAVTLYSNLTGGIIESFDDIPERLAAHIVSPVKFTSELNEMQKNGIDTYIEAGPGKVLSGLVKKTLKDVCVMNIENVKTLENALEILK